MDNETKAIFKRQLELLAERFEDCEDCYIGDITHAMCRIGELLNSCDSEEEPSCTD